MQLIVEVLDRGTVFLGFDDVIRELTPKEVPENDTHLYEDDMLEEDEE